MFLGVGSKRSAYVPSVSLASALEGSTTCGNPWKQRQTAFHLVRRETGSVQPRQFFKVLQDAGEASTLNLSTFTQVTCCAPQITTVNTGALDHNFLRFTLEWSSRMGTSVCVVFLQVCEGSSFLSYTGSLIARNGALLWPERHGVPIWKCCSKGLYKMYGNPSEMGWGNLTGH